MDHLYTIALFNVSYGNMTNYGKIVVKYVNVALKCFITLGTGAVCCFLLIWVG